METILKRREDYVQPSLGEAAARIKKSNEEKLQKAKEKAAMTVKDMFAKPNKISEDNLN